MATIIASGVGTMSIYVGGQLMELTGKVGLKHGGLKREPVKGPGGIIPGRWVESYMVPELDIEVSDGAGTNVTQMKDITNVPIQVAMRNGKTYTIANGICDGEVDGDLVAGKFSLKYFGASLTEVTK